jgi:hypothetical protein
MEIKWENENCNVTWMRHWYGYINGITVAHIKETIFGGYNAYCEKGKCYFDSLIAAEKFCEPETNKTSI